MKVELKNVRHMAQLSEETNCFYAELYLDGIHCGSVKNEGHGGCDFFSDHEAEKRLDAYAATLPPVIFYGKELTLDADMVVGEVLESLLIEREYKRAIVGHILFTKADKPGVFQTKKASKTAVEIWLTRPTIANEIGADKILNLLPLAEAVALYKAHAR